ncbi:MAG: VWA domain-containing protein [Rhodospirillaceae bacterium]|nr:VWA domain-containing protein [Rhodospirillales bacterium]
MLHGLELEERVGLLWHRLIGEKTSWPRHPEAEIKLTDMRASLAILFRALGGERGVQIAAAAARGSQHRLTWRQRIGMEEERLVQSSRDETSLSLPEELDIFPERALNRDLYIWLAAYFAVLQPPAERFDDPLRADLAHLAQSALATRAVLVEFPGLAARYLTLSSGLLAVRPRRELVGVEKDVEAVVLALLGGPMPGKFAEVLDGQIPVVSAPRGYRPFLPVPLWGEAVHAETRAPSEDPDGQMESPQGSAEEAEEKRRHAERRKQDNAERKDSLILNRFEKIMSFADMVNVNRDTDDTDEEEAKKAADDMDTITLAQHSRKAATRLKFDLDLPPEATDTTRLLGTHLYPEWDYRQGIHHPQHCSVLVGRASEEGESWQPDDAAKRRIRTVKRQFEALRTRPQIMRAQADGNELDTEAVVRARCDFMASGMGSERVYTQRRPMDRDLSVAILVDTSLSTDAWVENRRVLDVEKEALAVLGHGLAACGDPFAIYGFTSRKRSWVKIDTLKDFDETFSAATMRRIGALKPGYYTRIGAAIRHASAQLEKRPNRHRLLLVLTDGKPNDVDHYEGRYGIEDTRKAIHEARAKGLVVFGVTVDQKAQNYFPHLFGRGSFAIVHHLAHLSAALPRLYRQLVAG